MRKTIENPVKAYRNMEFLNSPDARIIRIMSEFLEPHHRFRRHGVKDTIVFFGSARIKAKAEARRDVKSLRAQLRKSTKGATALRERLREAEALLSMSKYYDDTVELARLLAEWSKKLKHPNRFVVCSGGGPGIMEAANKGAFLAKGKTIGMNISLPFEQFANRYISKGLSLEFHYFFLRKFWFAYLAKALVVFPGGFGTLDELMEILTLLQTQKIKKKMTVVIYGSEYWNKVINWEHMIACGVITKEDLKLFNYFDTPRGAFEFLKKSLMRNYPTQ
ncbi:MAG: Cytokinin riboside 5'-monophosphate phosphoribohydrolase [Bacteroidetes bacterium]|nr:Cytokinin riboside 5'-monophosphate phosphoribohydrolase [Bacteroidota bacterium]